VSPVGAGAGGDERGPAVDAGDAVDAAGGGAAGDAATAVNPATPRARAALWAPVAASLQRLASTDPRWLRFGAAHHRYQLRPPLSQARLAEIEAAAQLRLPEDYRDFVLALGDGGAGPYYGILALDQPAQLGQLGGDCGLGAGPTSTAPASAPTSPAPGEASAPTSAPALWRGVVALCHLGCGYLAYLVIAGPRRGQVWLDAAPVGVVACIAPHFISFYTGWLSALEQGEWPAAHVPPGRCALAQALSGYLGVVEQRLGRARGELGGAEFREALAALGPGSIQVVADASRSPVLPDHTVVAPCLVCEQLLLGLAEHGLARAALAVPHHLADASGPPHLPRTID
jgi:hypothetical protein